MAMSDGDGFLQTPPHLGNPFLADEYLRSLLCRLLPADTFRDAQQDLERFGWDVVTRIKVLGRTAEAQPPWLQKQDAWGSQVDALITSDAWNQLKALSAEEGLVAAAYEQRHGAHSRLYQMAKLLLFGASSGLFNCPLAMTDGAAHLCQQLLLAEDQGNGREQLGRAPLVAELREAFDHLISRDPAAFWTSGQWMTEKAGGSDVGSATETTAMPEPSSSGSVGSWFRLNGYKWFTSAADGEMAMALARELDGQRRQAQSGGGGSTSGLTLFYVPVRRDEQGRPEGFEVVRLKEKLGTRQLPTAELRLHGMRALKVSERGRGVAAIAAMVNITRLHNTAAACSYMRRITLLAQDYAHRRVVFGRPLAQQPLALCTLAWLELRCCGSLAIMLEVARLLGLQDAGRAAAAEVTMLRLLTPLAKMFTAKEAVAVCSEGLEFFGGNGYCEDTHIPVILRDAQVLPIWEGTTNVLALDVLRVLGSRSSSGSTGRSGGSSGPAAVFFSECRRRIGAAMAVAAGAAAAKCQSGESRLGPAVHAELLRRAGDLLRHKLDLLQPQAEAAAGAGAGSDAAQVVARDLSLAMSRMFVGALLLEHAAWSLEFRHILLATEWCRQVLLDEPGTQRTAARAFLKGSEQVFPDSHGTPAAVLEAANAQLRVAWILAGADGNPTQPRAKY